MWPTWSDLSHSELRVKCSCVCCLILERLHLSKYKLSKCNCTMKLILLTSYLPPLLFKLALPIVVWFAKCVALNGTVGVASLDLFMAKMNKRNSSEPLKEGDLVELECVAYNSKPAANITWFNGADSIEQLDSTAIGNNNWNNNKQQSRDTQQQQKPGRHKRLLQRSQVHQNSDGQTYTTHSFLSIKLSRHEHRAQISCQAQNAPMRQPMVKSLELQVQRKCTGVTCLRKLLREDLLATLQMSANL